MIGTLNFSLAHPLPVPAGFCYSRGLSPLYRNARPFLVFGEVGVSIELLA